MRLLSMWRFRRNRESLLEKLSRTADPATKIVMWQEFVDLPAQSWLIAGANVLLRRPICMTNEEGSRLGVDNVLRLTRISDQYTCQCLEPEFNSGSKDAYRVSYCSSSRRCPRRLFYNFDSMIREHYNLTDDGSRKSSA